MLYVVKNHRENKIRVVEMRILCCKIRRDKIENNTIRERVEVALTVETMVETRYRCFVHVEERPVDCVGTRKNSRPDHGG